MSIRAVKSLRLVRCLQISTKSTLSSIFTQESIPRSYHRLGAYSSKLFSSASSDVSGSNQISKISIETGEFAMHVSELKKSLDLTHTSPESLQQALVNRSYLTAHASKLKHQYKHNDQLVILGSQTMKRCLTELLLQHYSHLSLQKIWDLQNGIVEDQNLPVIDKLQLSKCTAYESPTRGRDAVVQSLMALVGVIYINEGTEKSRQFVYDHILRNLDENQLQQIIKLQHPKYILKHLSLKNDKTLTLRSLKRKANKHPIIGVFEGEKCQEIGTGSTMELAVRRACQNALLKMFPEELKQFNFSYGAEDFEFEEDIDLGLHEPHQRLITIVKENEEFGFNIKGGERKKLKNKEWLAFNYFSPIFVYSIQPDSLADRLGSLKVGDVILAVNDRSFVNIDHDAAVKILKQASGTVTLTVQHSKEVVLIDRVETEYKKMQERRRLAELTSDVWAEWHRAQADKYPEKYADVLALNEKQASQ